MFNQNDFKDTLALKPSEGVTFVEYDKYGFKKDDNTDFLAKEGDNVGFEFIAPNPEQMSKVLQIQEEAGFQGGRVDIDKTVNKMNQEEKAVFECLEDE